MHATLDTLETARRATGEALVAKAAENPVRAGGLALPRSRNTWLDTLFYDVSVISDEEVALLGDTMAHEGAVLVVPPSGAGMLSRHEDFDAFVASGEIVGTIAVAGVGSSALGGAALGRNIADAIEAPVGVVVSGYGFADLAAEALGGWFWFGALNSMRHAFEGLDQWSRLFGQGAERLEASDLVRLVRLSKDVDTLLKLLEVDYPIDLLVGHSKGNLVISEALYWLRGHDPARFAKVAGRAAIITLCAKIGMPVGCSPVIDVTGEYDGFGAINSRLDIRADYVVPHAWHSTNREFPFEMGLDVTRAVRAVLPMLERPKANRKRMGALPAAPLTDLPQAAAGMIPR